MSLEAILKQYENTQKSSTSDKPFISNEERLKKYFATFLPKGTTEGEKTIRILPTTDGSSPFKEVFFHCRHPRVTTSVNPVTKTHNNLFFI